MNKWKIFKYTVLALISLILFPIGPLIIGSFIIYKIIKSSLLKKNKLILAGLIIIVSFALTGKIVNALPTPPATSNTEVKSEKTEVSPEPTLEPTKAPSPNPNIMYVKVTNVVDGDTFKIESGETVRMIGIDTPETVHPSKPVQCYGKEASLKTQELIEGKEIKLEKDVSEKDKYGRLLRYVYLGDIFLNEYLVREGYAMSSSYPPDIKYQDKFVGAQKKAQEENKGLWSPSACPTTTPKPTVTPKPATPKPVTTTYYTPVPTTQTSGGTSGGSSVCNCSKTCSQMSSCAEAQYQLNVCGCSARDADDDGIACDSDCQ
jgi:micrococcal nuclease